MQKDCENLAALSIQVWLDTYATQGVNTAISQYALSTSTHNHFSDLLKQPAINTFIYEEDDHLVGFVTINLASRFNDNDAFGYEIATLYVSRDFQGKGIGRTLLDHVSRLYGRDYWLSVWVQNQGALQFYARLGLLEVGKTQFELDGEAHQNLILSPTAAK
nr:GNAT family N-acetyltransferase [Shewanella sp. NIFS-20-20]